MEKHGCKLCSKSFSNGRVLGGHMKSRLVASQHESSAESSSSSSYGKSPSYSWQNQKKDNDKDGSELGGSEEEEEGFGASSVSDASPEEDLAMCLIMLSRDARNHWGKLRKPGEEDEEMRPEKRQCLIDLNLPPPSEEDEAFAV
ncbi:PREDICTED: zinc finger protein ZAT9-like [Tarenaya hassleriana]|uniref:zinc finger protein ZAT9-like n=1 Tax=Tarenaya hassleriana TaxID=28532 RepID=UPI00053C4DCF|nr:PREDICTED: zinc finger protein ZAT9-like [Tarenaya hassleriana]